MLSTQILVQSYAWTFSVHISVNLIFTMLSIQIYYKYHIYAQCSLQKIPINRMLCLKFTMLSTQILVQSYTRTHFHSIFLLNLMFTMLSMQIYYKYHIYAQCSLQKIPIIRKLYLIFTMLCTHISYKYHIRQTVDFKSDP